MLSRVDMKIVLRLHCRSLTKIVAVVTALCLGFVIRDLTTKSGQLHSAAAPEADLRRNASMVVGSQFVDYAGVVFNVEASCV